MKKTLIITLILSNLISFSQEDFKKDKFAIGFGIGQMYGGVGTQLNYEIINNVELFTAFGYNLNDLGLNGGVKYKFLDKRTKPFITAMYGYNTVLIIENQSNLNKTFYGLTIGAGIDIKSKKKSNFWTFSLLAPIRPNDVIIYKTDLMNNNGVEFKRSLFPFTLSIGYMFKL